MTGRGELQQLEKGLAALRCCGPGCRRRSVGQAGALACGRSVNLVRAMLRRLIDGRAALTAVARHRARLRPVVLHRAFSSASPGQEWDAARLGAPARRYLTSTQGVPPAGMRKGHDEALQVLRWMSWLIWTQLLRQCQCSRLYLFTGGGLRGAAPPLL